MATYKFYLFDSKANQDTYIILRLAENKKTFKFYTDLKITPKDWNPKTGEARKTYRGFSDFNKLLLERKKSLKELHEKLKNENSYTTENLRRMFYEKYEKIEKVEHNTNDFKNLTDFAQYFLDTVKTTINGKAKTEGTKIQNKQTLTILKGFETAKHKRITFDKVTLDFYHDFIDYLTKTKKLSPNTIGRHIKTLKLFLNEATERGVNTKFDYRSKRFKALSEPVEKIYLTEGELLKIYKHDFSKNKKLDKTRDLFIVGCYTGLRFSDFSQLTTDNINNEQIKVKPQKTGETVVIPIHWTVKEILEKYSETAKGLPRSISNQKMNEYLKDMGEEVEINDSIIVNTVKGGLRAQTTVPKYKLIATHTARRSFASNLYLSGFPAISIMKITGHKTEKSFMGYLRISQEENANQLQKHWSANTKLKVV
jgi:site-specific recombinase XerD